jgi:8-oxo-dGTP pyrophosphatase MutT (NUDIX family)
MKEIIRNKVRSILMERMDKITAGVLIKCITTGRLLLLLRNDNVDRPNTWSLVSGGVEHGESILEGLKREVEEELSIDPSIIDFRFAEKMQIPGRNKDFYYYQGFTMSEFNVTLCEENLDFGWFDKDDLPEPLYPEMDSKIKNI